MLLIWHDQPQFLDLYFAFKLCKEIPFQRCHPISDSSSSYPSLLNQGRIRIWKWKQKVCPVEKNWMQNWLSQRSTQSTNKVKLYSRRKRTHHIISYKNDDNARKKRWLYRLRRKTKCFPNRKKISLIRTWYFDKNIKITNGKLHDFNA